MKLLNFSIPVAALCAMLGSCTPPPPAIPPGAPDPGLKNGESIVSADQKAVEEKRKQVAAAEKKRKAAAAKRREEARERLAEIESPDTPTPPKPEVKPKTNWPFATPVPGNEGFVYSPYNNKLIDVRTMASGQLVKDPDDPADSRNYFRVP